MYVTLKTLKYQLCKIYVLMYYDNCKRYTRDKQQNSNWDKTEKIDVVALMVCYTSSFFKFSSRV